jgi:membrane fusion protein, multidrug efflux system
MNKRKLFLGVVVVLALGGIFAVQKGYWAPMGAVAQAPKQNVPRVVPVDVAVAVKKKVPVRIDLLGTVTPIAGVAVKTRIDTEIVGVHFRDGSMVRTGDLLFTMDGRAIEAQVRQFEGQLARDKASLEGADRDLKRYTELVAKSATPVVNLDNSKTQADMFRGAIKADEGSLENLKVQLTYCEVHAPITGRISQAAVKVGNFVRQADLIPIATIIQTKPIYVSFTVPQRDLADIREALRAETATVEAIVPGSVKRAGGAVTMIENTVDPATGMAMIRATMPNDNEILWPGTLVNVQLTLRDEDVIVVPTAAVQLSQSGSFVYVVQDGKAAVRPVKVERTFGNDTVIASGLEVGETVVTDGQLLLSNGTRVAVRERKAGA